MIASLEDVLLLLKPQEVRFIVIGGWAAIIHGNARSTNDVDLVTPATPITFAASSRLCERGTPTYEAFRQDCPFAGMKRPSTPD